MQTSPPTLTTLPNGIQVSYNITDKPCLETTTYVYDFKGRVTQPSIKNFQLIPSGDGKRGETLGEFVLQFGKRGKDMFVLDAQFPISIF